MTVKRAEDLSLGDTIGPESPPTHCGYEMNIYDTEGYGWALDCINDDCSIGTDEGGVINELYPTGLKR